MKTISRYIMTLALLLTAVTGAWAAEPELLVTITIDSNGNPVYSAEGLVTLTGTNYTFDEINGKYFWFPTTPSVTMSATVAAAADNVSITKVVFWSSDIGNNGDYNNSLEDTAAPYVCYANASVSKGGKSLSDDFATKVDDINISKIEVYGTAETIEVIPVAEPAANTKQWTFSMPGSDVVLTPIYAKAAAFATTGTEPDVKTLLPAAAEGVIAGTDASLIAEGTGIVAFAGTSTEDTQGTLMYAIGTSATEAPALTDFSATVPTAKDIADDGATVYVWYYIQGADAPQGEAATLDNTFDNTEPAYLTVQVLTNKFDIQFNAANANTIEDGKATVTVGGTDKTGDITEGKLQGVKMGSEVKVKANTGYKFRKVEVKKKAAGKPVSEITSDDIFKVIASDGMIYDNIAAAESAGTVAQGLVVYVGSNTGHNTYTHGMALALKDESDNTWSGAKDACNAKNTSTPIVGALWIQASKDQWNTMFNAVGNDSKLRDCFSSAGGTNLLKFGNYWSGSSHEDYGEQGDFYMFSEDDWPGDWGSTSVYYNDNYHVRACIVF